VFSLNSDLFHVETWNVNGSQSVLSAQAGQHSDFKLQIRAPDISKRPVQVSCRLSGSQNPNLLLTIQLMRMYGIWSIREIFERKQSNRKRKLRTLFISVVPADRCSIQSPDGKPLLVKLRRLPSSARSRGEDSAVAHRYQILID
jgi:hypothetical protein